MKEYKTSQIGVHFSGSNMCYPTNICVKSLNFVSALAFGRYFLSDSTHSSVLFMKNVIKVSKLFV